MSSSERLLLSAQSSVTGLGRALATQLPPRAATPRRQSLERCVTLLLQNDKLDWNPGSECKQQLERSDDNTYFPKTKSSTLVFISWSYCLIHLSLCTNWL